MLRPILALIIATQAGPPSGFTPLESLTAPTGALAVPVTLSVRGAPLADALTQVAQRAKLAFVLDRTARGMERLVTARFDAVPAATALRRLLEGTDFRALVAADGQVVIARRSPAPGDARAASAAGDTSATARIRGQVTDSATLRPVTLAEVRLRGTTLGAVTDLEGRFVLRAVQPGTQVVEVRHIGHHPSTIEGLVVRAGETLSLNVALVPAAFQLSEVTVAPGSFSFLELGASTKQVISREAIETAPFGEDLFRAMNRLPGLSSDDYGAQFSIRGGRRDETLILLDGLEIHEPFHLKDFNEGALSIIDVETIDGVDLLTGGFPVRFGDRTSGVMDITSRTPKGNGTRVGLGASFANAHAMAEGGFADGRGSWLASGRSGFVNLMLGMLNKKETKAPSYEDAFATVRYALRPNHRLAVSVLHARDRYQFTIRGTTGFRDTIPTLESADNTYGNSYAWMTLRSLLGSHLSVRTLASLGSVSATRAGDERQTNLPIDLYRVNGSRGFSVTGFKQEYSYRRWDRMTLDWGIDVRSMRADFDWTTTVLANPDLPVPDTTGFFPRITTRTKKTRGTTVAAYVSDRLQLLAPLTLEFGVRHDAATYSRDRDWSPRLMALLRLGDRNTLRAGWGMYRQRQAINDENAFTPTNGYFRSELSTQWTMGLEHTLASGGTFRAEAYHKVGSRLRPIQRNWKSGLNVFPEITEDRILVEPSATTSKGLELYFDRSLGRRTKLRAGYALAFVSERLSALRSVNDPLKPAFDSTHQGPRDQRHALNADLTYRLLTNWTLTGAFTFHSGWPFTREIGVSVVRRNGQRDLVIRPDTLYGSRLPDYQRVDLRLTWRRPTRAGEWRLFTEVINLTNHQNVLGYDVFKVQDGPGLFRTVSEPETWFSILPTVGIGWTRRF